MCLCRTRWTDPCSLFIQTFVKDDKNRPAYQMMTKVVERIRQRIRQCLRKRHPASSPDIRITAFENFVGCALTLPTFLATSTRRPLSGNSSPRVLTGVGVTCFVALRFHERFAKQRNWNPVERCSRRTHSNGSAIPSEAWNESCAPTSTLYANKRLKIRQYAPNRAIRNIEIPTVPYVFFQSHSRAIYCWLSGCSYLESSSVCTTCNPNR